MFAFARFDAFPYVRTLCDSVFATIYYPVGLPCPPSACFQYGGVVRELGALVNDAAERLSETVDPAADYLPVALRGSVTACVREVMVIQNHVPAEGGALDDILTLLVEVMSEFPKLSLAVLASCASVWSRVHMARLVETSIANYAATEPDSHSWAIVADMFVVPEMFEAEFLGACLANGYGFFCCCFCCCCCC